MRRNAFFQLVQKEDGLYLKSYPALEGGLPITSDDVVRYLDSRIMADYSVETVHVFTKEAAEKLNAEVKLVDGKQIPVNEYAVITMDKGKSMAKVRLYPPSNTGKRITAEELKDLLKQNDVKFGYIDRNIEVMLKARIYCTDILVARQKPPVQGHSAFITYNFDTQKTSVPQMAEDGSVDYHSLDMIERVEEGQLLATLTPAEEGQDGTDITGNPIRPAKVFKKQLKHGKNIHLSEDGLQMFSEVSGNVTLVNDTVFVSNVYEVPADVGPSTGDIEYDGSVVVKGNVLTGYTVKAAGDITVNGAVEGATLEAGGKIVLRRGIQGMGKGSMKAEGNVISNFIESSSVESSGMVITDAIMHSDVLARGNIEVKGKRGIIAGGRVRSDKTISVKVAGSTMGTQTELEVGFDPTLVDKYHLIEKEIEALDDERTKLVQNIQILQKRLKAKGSLAPDKLKMLKESTERVVQIDERMEEQTDEYDRLESVIEESTGSGKIIVEDIAYPGVKITISNVSTFINTATHHSAFVREGADIRIKGI